MPIIRHPLQSLGEPLKAIDRIEKFKFYTAGRQDGFDSTAALSGPLQTNDVNFHDLPLQTPSVFYAVRPSR
ncbi:hypothetical protein D3C78_1907980 [compost metagenome]